MVHFYHEESSNGEDSIMQLNKLGDWEVKKKSQDPARIWTQDLLISSQTLLQTELLGPDPSTS